MVINSSERAAYFGRSDKVVSVAVRGGEMRCVDREERPLQTCVDLVERPGEPSRGQGRVSPCRPIVGA